MKLILKDTNTKVVVLFGFCVAILSHAGCGKSATNSALPTEQAAAVKALQALKVQTAVRDGQVTYVDFYGIQGVPDAMVHLKSLPNVQKLNFSNTDITDDSLANLKSLTNLKELAVNKTKITDKGTSQLAGLTKLEVLNFNNDAITDAGLECVKNMKDLVQLHLNETKVSDAGLKHLADCQKLTSLLLFGTQVTHAGVDEFRKTHPHTKITTKEGDIVGGEDEERANAAKK